MHQLLFGVRVHLSLPVKVLATLIVWAEVEDMTLKPYQKHQLGTLSNLTHLITYVTGVWLKPDRCVHLIF